MVIKMKNYSIKEVSEIFAIPKSTLRYWESEKLIHCIHNDNNEYREYTSDDLVQIADIVFYRSLNIPIKSLKGIYELSYAHYLEFLQSSYNDLDSKIMELITIKEKVGRRMESITTFQKLAIGEAVFSKPFFKQIKHISFREKKNVIPYVNDQNILAICFRESDIYLDIRGIISDDLEENENTLWMYDENKQYVPCLIKITNRNIDTSTLLPIYAQAKKEKKKVSAIVANYLITDKSNDFYQGWVELTK